MKEKILNLENFNEIAFDLIKKENGNSEVIKYEVNSSDRLSESVIEEILKNTPINELSVFLKEPTSDYPEDSERNNVPFGEFRYTDELDIIKDEYSSIAFLIQSQGYEVEDIFNEEKIENSKFLKSLRFEIDEYLSIGNEGSVGFFKGKNSSNLSELFDVLDSEKGSNLEIELEKDIVLAKENYKVFTEYSSGDKFEINHFFEDYESKKDETKFEISLDKNFEMHEVDINKVKETIDKTFDVKLQEKKEKENEKEL